jgi:hypothetical protein
LRGTCAQQRALIGCTKRQGAHRWRSEEKHRYQHHHQKSFVCKKEPQSEAQSKFHQHNEKSVVQSLPPRMSESEEGGNKSMEDGAAVGVVGQGGEAADGAAVEQRPPTRRSHQFRALSRRTATYHRRQWKLDLCCLGLCPA